MNSTRSTLIGTAVAIALFAQNDPARAQQLEEVIVTGIRFSNQKSLDTKRGANSVVEVVTAEDIGKMPDKNVADSLSRLPGVTVSSASANEGGFDENDRISMRGTNPEPDPDSPQWSQRCSRRLVRAEPGPASRPQRELHVAAV